MGEEHKKEAKVGARNMDSNQHIPPRWATCLAVMWKENLINCAKCSENK